MVNGPISMNVDDEGPIWYVGLPPAPGVGAVGPHYFNPLPGQHPEIGDVVCRLDNGLVYRRYQNGVIDANPVGRWVHGFIPGAPLQDGGRRRRFTRRHRKSRKVTRRHRARRSQRR